MLLSEQSWGVPDATSIGGESDDEEDEFYRLASCGDCIWYPVNLSYLTPFIRDSTNQVAPWLYRISTHGPTLIVASNLFKLGRI